MLLSIAIPTFNRAYTLNLLLDSISKQKESIASAECEIIILNNCSTDETEQVSLNFSQIIPNFRYICNNSNIGSDNNFVKAFSECNGDFIWLVGDDELLFYGAIEFVVNLCKNYKFGCAYLNSQSVPLADLPYFSQKSVPDRVDFFSYETWRFAQSVNYRLTFLSGSIINKKLIVEKRPQLYDEIEYFKNSNLIHLTWVLSGVVLSDVSIFVKTPMFASTIGNSSGYNPVTVFIANLGEFFNYFFNSHDVDPRGFINYVTLIGWFPRIAYDMRFKKSYSSTFKFTLADFPRSINRRFAWTLFSYILLGNRLVAFVSMAALKLWHRLYQCRISFYGKRLCQK